VADSGSTAGDDTIAGDDAIFTDDLKPFMRFTFVRPVFERSLLSPFPCTHPHSNYIMELLSIYSYLNPIPVYRIKV
jgi:hypothetical protein